MKNAVDDPPAPAPMIAMVFEALYQGVPESIVNALPLPPNHNQDGSRKGRLKACAVPAAARVYVIQSMFLGSCSLNLLRLRVVGGVRECDRRDGTDSRQFRPLPR